MDKVYYINSILESLEDLSDEITIYDYLNYRPQIEGATVEGDKTFSQLQLVNISNVEIDEIIYGGD